MWMPPEYENCVQPLMENRANFEDKTTCQAGIDRLLNRYECYHYGVNHNSIISNGVFGLWNCSKISIISQSQKIWFT